MEDFPKDIYTEPEPDVDTLANLGPLTAMAGIWTGSRGLDVSPKPDGPEKKAFIERIELQPIDAQTNGPQLLYGLRYHTHIVKPNDVETFHDQVGYWLWEPATGNLIQTLSIPRGQTAMAVGRAAADAKTFRLSSSPWFRDQRDRVQPVSGIRVQDGELHHHGFDTSRRNVVLRTGNCLDHPGSSRTVSPYRSQHAPEDRRAHAQSHGAGSSGEAGGILKYEVLTVNAYFRAAVPSDAAECVRIRGRTRENAISEERLRNAGITTESWARDIETGSLPGFVCECRRHPRRLLLRIQRDRRSSCARLASRLRKRRPRPPASRQGCRATPLLRTRSAVPRLLARTELSRLRLLPPPRLAHDKHFR